MWYDQTRNRVPFPLQPLTITSRNSKHILNAQVSIRSPCCTPNLPPIENNPGTPNHGKKNQEKEEKKNKKAH